MFNLSRFGVSEVNQDLNSNTIQSNSGKVLLYDGDGACYNSCRVAKMGTALRHLETDIYTKMYLAGCSSAWVHLTPRGCVKNGRGNLNTVKPYQGNRTNVAKPPLLEPLRNLALQHFEGHKDITIYHNYDIEADDALVIDHYLHNDAILISPDKDLTISPFAQYIEDQGRVIKLDQGDRYGYLDFKEWNSPSGTACNKVIGKGTKFFWAQMLMGDSADNVKGILSFNGKACGKATTYAILKDISKEEDAANLVIDAYREINQNVCAEGAAMWLLRTYDDDVIKYFMSCNLSETNVDYVMSCKETMFKEC